MGVRILPLTARPLWQLNQIHAAKKNIKLYKPKRCTRAASHIGKQTRGTNTLPSPPRYSTALRTLCCAEPEEGDGSERKTAPEQFLPYQPHEGLGANSGCWDPAAALGCVSGTQTTSSKEGCARGWHLRAACSFLPWHLGRAKSVRSIPASRVFIRKVWWWRCKRHFHCRKLKYPKPCFKAVFLVLKYYIKINFFEVSKDRCFRIKQQNKIWHVTMFSNAVFPNQLEFLILLPSTPNLLLASRFIFFFPTRYFPKERILSNKSGLVKWIQGSATHELWSKTEQGVNS